MSGADDDGDDDRLRRLRRLLAGSAAVAIVAALGVGVAGGDGRAGAAVFFLVASLGAGVAALYGVVTSLVDEFRDRPVSRARIGWSVGLFVLAAVLMAMVAGVGG